MNKNSLPKSTVAVIAASLVAWSPVQASVESDMANMFNSMGANATYTTGGAYHSQSANVYVGGGMSARWGNKSLYPVEIQLPTVNSGCGGIDFFSGAFGFANKEQFVEFVRNLGNNAAGVAFDIALDSLDPLIGGAISKIRALVTEVNQAGLNSCQSARSLVYGLAGSTGILSQKECEAQAIKNGAASDGAEARYICQSPAKQIAQAFDTRSKAIAGGSGGISADAKAPVEFTGGNVTLLALKNYSITDEEKRWLLSIMGTMIAPPPVKGASEQTGKTQYLPPTIHEVNDIVDFVGVGKTNTKVNVSLYKCVDPSSPGTMIFDGLRATKCTTEDVPYKSLKAMVQERVDKLVTSIATNTKIANNADVIALIENSDLPLLKMALMDASNKGGVITDIAIDGITYQLATKYLSILLRYSEEAMGSYATQGSTDQKQVELTISNLRAAREQLSRGAENAYRRAADSMALSKYVKEVNESYKMTFPDISNAIQLSQIYTSTTGN